MKFNKHMEDMLRKDEEGFIGAIIVADTDKEGIKEVTGFERLPNINCIKDYHRLLLADGEAGVLPGSVKVEIGDFINFEGAPSIVMQIEYLFVGGCKVHGYDHFIDFSIVTKPAEG